MKLVNQLKPALIGVGFLFLSGCGTLQLSSTEDVVGQFVAGDPQSQHQLVKACAQKKSLACAVLGEKIIAHPELAILQGYTDSQSTQVNVLLPRRQSVAYWLVESPSPFRGRPLSVARSVQQTFSSWRVDHLNIDGLKVGQKYQLWVSEKGQLIERRSFSALDLHMKTPHIVVASCLDDGFRDEQKIAWAQVAQKNPHMILLIGDNVYADKYLSAALRGQADPEGLWRRHVETRSRLDIYLWENLIPTLAIWDDHDYGQNNGGENYPHREFSQIVFRAFFPQTPFEKSALKAGPGVSHAFDGFGLDWYFLDGRSFRSPNHPDPRAGDHLGESQMNWLLMDLKKGARDKLAVLIKGDQFFGAHHQFESYEGSHPKEFKTFKAELQGVPRPMMLVSGDRHLIELLRVQKKDLGQDTFEFTTSALHAKTFPDESKVLVPRAIERKTGVPNFGVLKPRRKKGYWLVGVEGWSYDGNLIFSRELTLKGRSR